MTTDEPFELIVEEFAPEPRQDDAATLTLGYTDQSFTRPTTRRERALRAHAATLAARDTTPTLTTLRSQP